MKKLIIIIVAVILNHHTFAQDLILIRHIGETNKPIANLMIVKDHAAIDCLKNMEPIYYQTEIDGFPKGKVDFYFMIKPVNEPDNLLIKFRLKNYPDIDNFMQILTSYPNLDIEFGNDVIFSILGAGYKVF